MINFDSNWHTKKKRVALVVAVPVLLLVVSIAFAITKALAVKDDKILPPEKNGFVGKANSLIEHLLSDPDLIDSSVVRVRNINDLNRKYKALEFAMPYADDITAMREDIRLVGIRPEMIKSENERDFYHNSNLPFLLDKQRKDIGEKYFKIKSKRGNNGTEIESIKVIRSMFKVALEKDSWTGNIYAQANSLFEQDTCLFLLYGNTVIPMKIYAQPPFDNHYVQLRIETNRQTITPISANRQLDFYQYYRQAFLQNRYNCFVVNDNRLPRNRAEVFIKCVYDSINQPELQIQLNNGLSASVYAHGEEIVNILPTNHESASKKVVPFTDGMKMLLKTANGNQKLAEFSITKENPSLLLSTLIKSNSGTSRYIASEHTDVFTRQVLRGLATNLSNTNYPYNVHLSIDPLLSKEFENELRDYLTALKRQIASQRGQRWDISLTLLDMATGNVIAAPFVTEINEDVPEKIVLTRKNPALERRYIGSVFKPMLTLAAVEQNPSLLNLDTRGKLSVLETGANGCARGMFFGSATTGWGPKGHWNGCDMPNFLAHSDDVYPVALAALCLNNYDDNRNLNLITNDFARNMGGDSFFDRSSSNILIGDRSPSRFEFFQILDALYSINSYDESDADSVRMSNYLWRNLHLQEKKGKNGMEDDEQAFYGLSEVSPEATVMQYDQMIRRGNNMRGELTPWVLGQGNNYWNCIKLGEAWCRMLSKRAVSASLVINPEDTIPAPSLVDVVKKMKMEHNRQWTTNRIHASWNGFLNVFQAAQGMNVSGSTLYSMYTRVNELNTRLRLGNSPDRLVLFSKTGTPSEYFQRPASVDGSRSYIDLGIYCMGLMTERSVSRVKSNQNQPGHGIVCVIRVTRQYPRSTSNSGLSSIHARDFFTTNRLEKLYYMTRKYFNNAIDL